MEGNRFIMESPYNLSTKHIRVTTMPCFFTPRTEQPHLPVIGYCLHKLTILGSVLEFGVWSGISTNFIANTIKPQTLHAFDSFEGLHTEWNGLDADFFMIDYNKLRFEENVIVHKGLFFDTLSDVDNIVGQISFINIDCDLYESAREVLFRLNDKIVPHTIIYFDELYNYPDYKKGEYKALVEWTEEKDREVKTIAFNDTMGVAIEVLK